MTTLWGSNITHYRERRGMTKKKFAEEVGVSGATVSDWESGKIEGIEARHLIRAAQVLAISAEELFLEAPPAVNEPPGTYVVPTLKLVRVPVVATAQLGPDGYWTEMEAEAATLGHVPYPATDPAVFGLFVGSDSLRPRFKPGEVVIVQPNRPVESGNEVAVKTKDGRIMVRVLDFRRSGLVQLSSVNEDARPVTVPESQIEFVARVVGTAPADSLSAPPSE